MAGQNRSETLKKDCRRQKGQALAEYALIITFVAIVAVGALTLMGGSIQGFFNSLSGSF